MEKTFATQSLLPWLDPGAEKLHLAVSLNDRAFNKFDLSVSPFRLLDATSPLFNLLHASYKTPAGKTVKEIFLLVQKDQCSFTDQSAPFNNFEIDKIWLKAHKYIGAAGGLVAFDSLFGSLSSSGNETLASPYPLWQSLFYCVQRTCYFHPPCPKCGHLLELCQEDSVLSAAGLPCYSSTLERFLFCPSCHASQPGADFFTANGGYESFPMVKNCRALVAGFQQLMQNGLAGEDFPCRTCPEQNDCYSSERVSQRIHPFAFYPFRMLVTDAAQLPAQDFIAILSGASYEEVKQQLSLARQPGRVACIESLEKEEGDGVALFFANDPKNFLEILYVKVALLEQIAGMVLSGQKYLQHPDLKLSMAHFWVNFSGFKGLLPAFWNFSVQPVAFGFFPIEDIDSVKVPESFGLYSLAFMWLNTLLVNKEQTAADVWRALAELLDRGNGHHNEADFLFGGAGARGVFGPKNIYYLPAELKLPQHWADLWQKALGLGWSILQASFQVAKFSESTFTMEVSELAEDVKKSMFAAQDTLTDVDVGRTDDAEILQILQLIQKKWQAETPVEKENCQPESVAAPVPEPEPELASKVEEVGAAEVKMLAAQEEDLEKTVLLSAAQLAAMMATDNLEDQKAEKQPKDVAEEIPEVKAAGDLPVEEDLEKTVMINLHDLQSMLADNKVTDASGKEQQNVLSQPKNVVDGDISETVIISLEELEKLKKGKNGYK